MNYQCIVKGRVQGVYYRSYIQDMASLSGFDGYVKNLPNGTVEACVSLKNNQKLEQFLVILETGSPHSKVEHIETNTITEQFHNGFQIRR